MIRLDPDFSSYEEVTATKNGDAALKDNTRYYKVTDVMHALPAGLWDSTVAFAAEMTDVENGVDWVVRAPLGLVQRTLFTIEEAGEEDLRDEQDPEKRSDRLVLVEDVEIRCSRLLIGTVKSKIEGNWKGIHKRWIEQLDKLEA